MTNIVYNSSYMKLKEKLYNQGNYLFKYRGQVPLILLLIGAFIILQTSNYEQFNNEHLLIIQNIAILISCMGLLARYYTIGSTPYETSGKNRDVQIAKYF